MTGENVTGNTLFTFRQTARWCWNGTKVTDKSSYVTVSSPFVGWEYVGIIDESNSGVAPWIRYRQGHFRQCLVSDWSCLNHGYPWTSTLCGRMAPTPRAAESIDSSDRREVTDMSSADIKAERQQIATVALSVVVLLVLLPAVVLAMLADPWLSLGVGGVLGAVVCFVSIGRQYRIARILCGLLAMAAIVWGLLGLWSRHG